ncbi:hypothetical protein ABIA32_001338 [Streptacidiphilus sp. MAP12-20]|uniref:HNH endonuclease signature motif containing protein n=1 Tax=Streptacidiphilus sp. MAP12-20 TaxID=3156299 RepID=UPI00351213EB
MVLQGDALAAWLARVVPGAGSAALLDGLDAEGLSAVGRVDALVAVQRHVGWLQAMEIRLLAGLEERPLTCIPGAPDALADFQETREQVACALRVTPDTAGARLWEASQIASRFPAVLGLLAQGRVQVMHARVVRELTAQLDDAACARVEALVVGRMPEQVVSATRKAVARAVLKADPEGAEQRHASARRERRTSLRAEPDGMAWYGALLAAEDAAMVDAAVDAHARSLEGDGRTLPQRRADALVELVTRAGMLNAGFVPENGTGSPRATIVVTVPFDTLIGEGSEPADLKGYGPLTPGQAKALAFAPGSVWRRLITEPGTGRVVKTDPTCYRPTAEVQRHVVARDAYCRFPGCPRPAARCDLDHVRPFDHENPQAGGPTTPENLIALCRRHHLTKHRAGWQVHHDPATNTVTWTAPTGHTYSTDAHSYPNAA